MTRTRKTLIGILVILLLIPVVLVVVIATLDWNRFKPTINEKVSAAIGRPFAINGDLSVKWARDPEEGGWRGLVPWPHVRAQDLTVGNAPWAEAPTFAKLNEASFRLSPLPLIVRTVRIRSIQLTGAEVDLQRREDGEANWVFKMPESGEPSPWTMDIDAIGFDQGRITYKDVPLKADLEVLIDPLGKPIPFAEIAGGPTAVPGEKDGDGKNAKDAKDAKESKDAKDAKDTKESKDAKDAKRGENAADKPAGKAPEKAADKTAAASDKATDKAGAEAPAKASGAKPADVRTADKTAATSAAKPGDKPADGATGNSADAAGQPGDAKTTDAVAEARKEQPPPDYLFGWKVKGKYKDLAVQGEGKIGGLLALRDGNVPFPVQADVSAGSTKAAIIGTVTDPLSLGALDLRLKLAGNSMANLYPLTGVTLPDTPPYSTDGHLTANLQDPQGPVFDYRNFNGKVGASDLHGDLRFALQAPRPKLTGKLTSRQLRMEDLGPLIGVQSGAGTTAKTVRAEGEKASKQPADKALPVQEFRTDRWRDMDANVALAAGRIIHSSKLPLSDLDTRVVLQDGVLNVDPLNFGMAGGRLTSSVRLDGSKAPMDGRARISVRRLQLKQLFPEVESMQKTLGQLQGDANLAGTGNSIAALLGTANGDVQLLVNDGVISRSLMEIAGLNVGNYVVNKLFGDDEVKINCGAADLSMKSGLMKTNLFVFDTENALVTVDGTINFKNEQMDLDITPDSKGFRIFSLRSPLYVRGTFKDPKPGVHALPLAARGAGAVALGVVLTPAAGLLALIAPSNNDEGNQCAELFARMKQTPAKKPAPAKK
ncbi:AsmA family protein [Bordetella genomosp. 5]|uniref:AsmA family protein n=1 Tax=Bordetella genomosp. 5 TaxID=1395608 RepID=UPI002016648D|nr:AsmA family protein [Bordetella genomosp. 5]